VWLIKNGGLSGFHAIKICLGFVQGTPNHLEGSGKGKLYSEGSWTKAEVQSPMSAGRKAVWPVTRWFIGTTLTIKIPAREPIRDHLQGVYRGNTRGIQGVYTG
jgi:hypothetical protein